MQGRPIDELTEVFGMRKIEEQKGDFTERETHLSYGCARPGFLSFHPLCSS